MTVQNSALRGMWSCIIRAIWEMVNCLIAAQAKAGGYELHQVVLITICGNLHAARSNAQPTQPSGYAMSVDRPACEKAMSKEETTVSNMWEISMATPLSTSFPLTHRSTPHGCPDAAYNRIMFMQVSNPMSPLIGMYDYKT